MIAGFTEDEVLHEALVRTRTARAFVPGIEMREIDRPGWYQIVTPSFRAGGLNGVEHAVLDEAGADAAIDAALAEYDALGIRFRWTVTPACRPCDLGERLARRGLVGERVVVMAAAVDAVAIAPRPEVRVTRVDARDVQRFAEVTAAGWGTDPAPLLAYHRGLLADDRHQCFLAWIDGEPVAAANHVLLGRSVYLMGAVVLPAWRGRGAYVALVDARLRAAAAGGARLATTQARASTSAPLLSRLGFTPVAELWAYCRPG